MLVACSMNLCCVRAAITWLVVMFCAKNIRILWQHEEPNFLSSNGDTNCGLNSKYFGGMMIRIFGRYNTFK